MKPIIVTFAITLALAVPSAANASEWEFNESVDDFTDETLTTAHAVVDNDVARGVHLFVRCIDGSDFNVYFAFGYLNLTGTPKFRFDVEEPYSLRMGKSDSRKALFVPERDKVGFAHKLQANARLRVSLPYYNRGPVTLDIPLAGSSVPIGNVMEDCGVESQAEKQDRLVAEAAAAEAEREATAIRRSTVHSVTELNVFWHSRSSGSSLFATLEVQAPKKPQAPKLAMTLIGTSCKTNELSASMVFSELELVGPVKYGFDGGTKGVLDTHPGEPVRWDPARRTLEVSRDKTLIQGMASHSVLNLDFPLDAGIASVNIPLAEGKAQLDELLANCW